MFIIANAIADIKKTTGWPKFIEAALGKSKKVTEGNQNIRG